MELAHDMLTHGVNIVCAALTGQKSGMAVAWATQIASDQVLICVGAQSKTLAVIKASEAFGLSVLAQDQFELAQRFGTHHSDAYDKFSDLEVRTLVTGSPLLADCVVALDCRVAAVYDHGHEQLIVGQVVATRQGRSQAPRLLYTADDY